MSLNGLSLESNFSRRATDCFANSQTDRFIFDQTKSLYNLIIISDKTPQCRIEAMSVAIAWFDR